jgi:hypothetical protein
LKRFLRSWSEDDTKLEFEKLNINLEMEAARKTVLELDVLPKSKRPVGRPRKVLPQMTLLSLSMPVLAGTCMT